MALRVARLASSSLRSINNAAWVRTTLFSPSLRALSSAPKDLHQKPKLRDASALVELAKRADYPRDALQMIESCPDELVQELSKTFSAAEDPVGELNAMVATWLDPEANAASFEAMSAELLEEQQHEGTEADIEQDIDKVFDELDLDFDEGEVDMCNPEAAEQSDLDDDELEGEIAQGLDEDKANPLEQQDASDWRRLTAALEAAKQKQDSGEELSHPWFSTRKLVEGVTLPEYSEAGADPLKNVFGLTFESPPRSHNAHGIYQKPLRLYPGQQLDAHALTGQPPEFKRQPGGRSKRLVRKRECPFQSKRLNMPDHKTVGVISRFISESGKILPRRRTGINAKNQRRFARVVKRARHFGLIPTTSRLQPPQV